MDSAGPVEAKADGTAGDAKKIIETKDDDETIVIDKDAAGRKTETDAGRERRRRMMRAG